MTLDGVIADWWRRHWEFTEAGAITLRQGVFPHSNIDVVAYQGEVTVRLRTGVILNDRESARYLANRIMEAVAFAELQQFVDIVPRTDE